MSKQTSNMKKIYLSELIASSGVCFGTSGVRGLVSEMTEPLCRAYTAAFLEEVVPHASKVVLGHDLRPSSPAIAQYCAKAIRSAGREIVFAGPLPTPALALYSLQQGAAAIMVTGSHIPFDRNGIKFYSPRGEISKQDELAINMAQVALPEKNEPVVMDVKPAVLNSYRTRYLDFFPNNFLKNRRIGIYEHSSVARDLLSQILQAFGAGIISLGRSDDFVPIDTEAVSESDQAMASNWAKEHQLDAIISTDGDGDRPLIADEKGEWLRGDIVGILCARYLRADVVATPVNSNTALEKCGAFSRIIRTRIGSPYVIAAMEDALATGGSSVVGFEANGGFLIGNPLTRFDKTLSPLPTRDALLPILSLLALSHEKQLPLSKLSTELPQRFTASDRVQNFPSVSARALLAKLTNSPPVITSIWGKHCGELTNINQTDGLRLTFANTDIVHLRPSGNAPELRCYAESTTKLQAHALVKETLESVSKLWEPGA